MLSLFGLRIHIICHNCKKEMFNMDPSYYDYVHSCKCIYCGSFNDKNNWIEHKQIDKK